MNCNQAREQIGIYLDGELPAPQSHDLEQHIQQCDACRSELEQSRGLVTLLQQASEGHIAAPPELWDSISSRLIADRRPVYRIIRLFRRPIAAAASVAVLLGAATFVAFWLSPGVRVAQATVVDYRVLLDGLAADVDESVARFLKHYGGQPMTVAAIRELAAPMHFNIPQELPGGFKLEQAYRLQFGGSPGFAARYRRDSEPLFVFFHPPVDQTLLGVHQQSHCDVAGRGGQRVEVGPWQLIHYTDPTTCHCLLSRLEREQDLHAVLAAISPAGLSASQPAH